MAAAGAVGGYLGLVTGALPVDLGVARRFRALGPLEMFIPAPREVVFDVVAAALPAPDVARYAGEGAGARARL